MAVKGRSDSSRTSQTSAAGTEEAERAAPPARPSCAATSPRTPRVGRTAGTAAPNWCSAATAQPILAVSRGAPTRPSSCSTLPIGGATPGRVPGVLLLTLIPRSSACPCAAANATRMRLTAAAPGSAAPRAARRPYSGRRGRTEHRPARRAPSLPALRVRQKKPLKRRRPHACLKRSRLPSGAVGYGREVPAARELAPVRRPPPLRQRAHRLRQNGSGAQ